MIDILLNFRTTYVEEGEVLVTKPLKIAIYYIKSYFLVDLVAAIPWELLIDPNSKEVRISSMKADNGLFPPKGHLTYL